MAFNSSFQNNKKPILQDMIVKKSAPARPPSVPVTSEGAQIPIRRQSHSDPLSKKDERAVSLAQKPESNREAHTLNADSFFTKMKSDKPQEVFSVKEPLRHTDAIFGVQKRWYVKKPMVILYGVLAFTFFLLVIDVLSGATVAITPHQEFFNIDTLVKVPLNGAVGGVETVHVEEAIQGSADTHGEQQVEEKASGSLTIYNEFSSEPQVLVKRTRFETPDGKIYRIQEQVTVPGAVIKDGKVTPSSIQATIYADEAGEEYNIGASDFTIPGFKGSPRFEKFYARSSTPTDGGFKGKAKVVTENDASTLASSLETQLSEELRRRVSSELPEDLFIPSGASRMVAVAKEFSAGVGKPADVLSLELALRFDGLAVPFETIEKEIIAKYLSQNNASGNAFDIVNVRNLSYTAADANFDTGAVTLRIQGLAHIAWHIDYEGLASALAGAGFRKQVDVFSEYPAIEEAAISFSPSWWRIFPNTVEKIIVERKLFESPQE